jgi:hypothetical protein
MLNDSSSALIRLLLPADEGEHEGNNSPDEQARATTKNPDGLMWQQERRPFGPFYRKKTDSRDDPGNSRCKSQHSENPSTHYRLPDKEADQADEEDNSNDWHDHYEVCPCRWQFGFLRKYRQQRQQVHYRDSPILILR